MLIWVYYVNLLRKGIDHGGLTCSAAVTGKAGHPIPDRPIMRKIARKLLSEKARPIMAGKKWRVLKIILVVVVAIIGTQILSTVLVLYVLTHAVDVP